VTDAAGSEERIMARQRWVDGVQEWLYVIIVASLALYLVIGLLLWSWMILVGRATPDAFTTILAAIAGALAGIVTPLQGPPPRRRESAEG
jgi:CHASE2 domain-containing sensor protein